MQEDHRMQPSKRGTSKVTIVLLQVLLFLNNFVKRNYNVVVPFFISFATMLLPILTCFNSMSPLFVYIILFLSIAPKHQWFELYNYHWSTMAVAQGPQILEF